MDITSSARRVTAVASITFREAWSRRVVLAAALMALGFLAIYGTGLHFVGAQGFTGPSALASEVMRRAVGAQLLYLGLSTASFLIALTAVFVSAGTVSADVDSAVVYGVLARPIRRAELVVGKYLGLAVMLSVFGAVLNGAVIGLTRWQMAVPLLSWPGGMALLVLEPLPLLALSVLGSSRLPTLANGVLCTAAYGIGLIGGLMEQIGGVLNSATLTNLGIVTSLLMPLDAVHRKALAALLPSGLLFQQGGVPGMSGAHLPSTAMMVYAGCYAIVLVALGAFVFSKRDL